MLYKGIKDSFEFFVVPQHENDPDWVNFEAAHKMGMKEEGGAILAQMKSSSISKQIGAMPNAAWR